MHDYEKDALVNPLWGTQREIALSENIVHHLSPHSKNLLDVGCGDGFFLYYLHQIRAGLQLSGVDMSTERLKRCANNLPFVEFIRAEVEQLPFESKKFDTVVCSEVLEHVWEPLKALVELWRVTKQQLIITVPNDQPITPVDCPQCEHRFYLSGHLHQINTDSLRTWSRSLEGAEVSFYKFHTIFTYNRVTLKWPRFVRRVADRVFTRSDSLISFAKPNFLMMVANRKSLKEI